VATFVAVGACLALAFGAGGASGAGGLTIWPLFGTTNQLLAGLTLMVISVMLVKLSRPVWYTLVPLTFLLAMTILALLFQLWDFYTEAKWFLLGLDIVILVAAIFVALEAVSAFLREKAKAAEATGPAE
jgi:carbon starvation protein